MLAFWNRSNESAGAWMWLNYMLLSWMAFVHSLSRGKNLGPVVRNVDNAIHRINLYPADNAIGSAGQWYIRWIALSNVWIVCYTAVFRVVTQRSSPLRGGALRDETKNGCVAD